MALCSHCGEELQYEAELGAPGIGSSWKCLNNHNWIRIGNAFLDPADWEGEEPPWVMSPEEAR